MESFIEEIKRFLGFSEEDVVLLVCLGPRLEKYFLEMSERFYSQVPHHSNASRVFTGGALQIERLKHALQLWARSLFSGVYNQAYADERYHIGHRHVQLGLEQRYVIGAMGIVRSFFNECLLLEFSAADERRRFARALGKILDLDLNLMCESYMRARLEGLRSLNGQLEHANRELAEAAHAKDEFLAHVSHELRTPISSIMGFSRLIIDGLCTGPGEERQLLQDVFSSAQHLLDLVNDIIDIGRIEAGQLALHIEDVNPRQVIASTLPLLTVQAANKKLVLSNETAGLALPMVRADEVRFRQVLLNLLTNAVKFTPSGSVTVRAAQLNGLRLEVEDTGIGVPPEKRELVFQKFFQLDPARSKRSGGIGLGLSISRKLLELMGGDIGMETGRNGQGTLVWCTLPLADGTSTASAATTRN